MAAEVATIATTESLDAGGRTVAEAVETGALRLVSLPASVASAPALSAIDAPAWAGTAEQTDVFMEWAADTMRSTLPAEAVAALEEFKAGHGPPALLLRGLGVEGDLEGTDEPRGDPLHYVKVSGARSETCILGATALFGDRPHGPKELREPPAGGGEAEKPQKTSVGHLISQRARVDSRSPAGSSVPLLLHRDGMFDEFGNYTETNELGEEIFLPDKLYLFCNRADPDSICTTYLHTMKHVYQMLSEGDRALLREVPMFFTMSEQDGTTTERMDRQRNQINPDRTGTVTIYGPEDNPTISLQEVRPVDRSRVPAEAADAYERLRTIANATRFAVPLMDGDLLILRNNKALHGRSTYEPRYDSSDRWIQRFSSYTPSQLEAATALLEATATAAAAAAATEPKAKL